MENSEYNAHKAMKQSIDAVKKDKLSVDSAIKRDKREQRLVNLIEKVALPITFMIVGALIYIIVINAFR